MVRRAPEDLELIEALRRCELLWPGELPRIAVSLIRDARSPESLFALAAFHPPDLAGIEEVFDRAWLDLRSDCLDVPRATRRVSVELARLVMRGGMEPMEGLQQIIDLCAGLREPWVVELVSLQSWCEACVGADQGVVLKVMSDLAGEKGGPGAQPIH